MPNFHARTRFRTVSSGSVRIPYLILFAALLFSCGTAPDIARSTTEIVSQVRPGTHLILLIHGSGDSPTDWPRRMEAALQEAQIDKSRTRRVVIIPFDWSDVAEQRLRAPRRGLSIGHTLGRQVGRALRWEGGVTIISHSAGAFVAHGVAQVLSGEGDQSNQGWRSAAGVEIRQIFLDPFLARSPLNWRYGVSNFGRYADLAAAYVNTLDPVPFTNRFPVHAHRVDVSDDEHADDHWWPVDYVLAEIQSGSLDVLELPEASD